MTGTADSGPLTLDAMFEWLEGVVPEGYKSEIVGGHIIRTDEFPRYATGASAS